MDVQNCSRVPCFLTVRQQYEEVFPAHPYAINPYHRPLTYLMVGKTFANGLIHGLVHTIADGGMHFSWHIHKCQVLNMVMKYNVVLCQTRAFIS
jgi:hypothetical protein